ncbi:MAG: DUF554 domain-containing protein [Spirochaetota bacterium]|nr:MAG: DUF554 domain-containing protein [Spirochaetota bacterium]
MPLGTIVNAVAVMVGSTIGTLIGKRFPERIRKIVFQAIGLSTLVIGMRMAFEVQSILVLIFSLLLGGVTGEFIKLHDRVNKAADGLKSKFKNSQAHFSEGLVTAFLIFCIGSMTIVGAIDEGLRGDHTILFTKSVLDGFTSLALASTYGFGVFFSAIPLFLFQAGITLLANLSQDFFSTLMIAQLTAVGGAMIIGIGINLLDIKQIRIINLLPALIWVVLFTRFFPGIW